MGRSSLRLLLVMARGLVVAGCGSTTTPRAHATPPPPAFCRVTGLIRASCYEAPPNVGQGFCTLHGQIQNEGGPGHGGIGELILEYRPKDSDELVTATCATIFPPLDTKDVAEVDCFVVGNPLIYSNRIVSTDIMFLPLGLPAPVSGARVAGPVQRP